MGMTHRNDVLIQALQHIYHRTDPPPLWHKGGTLPWNDPVFSARMLTVHLDDTNGAASRISSERRLQLAWLWTQLKLAPDRQVVDITCGPGFYAVDLARRGCIVTGVDFSPASIAYAQDLATQAGVAARCTFIEQDIRQYHPPNATFDAALLIYGQLAVFPKHEAQQILRRIYQSLRPGGMLCVELLNPDHVDRTRSQWWFTDDTGLWGDQPFVHLGERYWYEAEQVSVERFYTINLETGQLTEISLCDQVYPVAEMVTMMQRAGFATVETFVNWDNVPLYDAYEWVVYVAHKK